MTSVFWRFLAGLTGLAMLAASASAADPSETRGSSSPPEKHTLRYKFRAGETVRWKVVHRARVETSVSGTSQTAETVTTSTKVWKVQKVEPNGTAVFEQLVDNVDMWQKLSGRMEVRYNSQTDKKTPAGFEGVAKSIGVPLSRTTIDPQGKILKREHLVARPQGENEGLITVPLPESPVAVGESWTYPCDIEVPLERGGIKKIKSRQIFTLEAAKNGTATIRVATQILTPVDDPAIEARLMQRDTGGTVTFDIEGGRVTAQQMDTDKRVVGFRGEASSLHCRTRFTEELLAQGSQPGDGAKPATAAPAEKTTLSVVPKSAARTKPADAEARK
jgi:hypothetical protein